MNIIYYFGKKSSGICGILRFATHTYGGLSVFARSLSTRRTKNCFFYHLFSSSAGIPRGFFVVGKWYGALHETSENMEWYGFGGMLFFCGGKVRTGGMVAVVWSSSLAVMYYR